MSRQFNKDNSEEDFTPRRDSRKKSDTGKKRPFSSGNRKRNYSEDNDSEDSDRKFSKKRFPKENDGERKSGRGRKFDGDRDSDRSQGRSRKFDRENGNGNRNLSGEWNGGGGCRGCRGT